MQADNLHNFSPLFFEKGGKKHLKILHNYNTALWLIWRQKDKRPLRPTGSASTSGYQRLQWRRHFFLDGDTI